MTTTAPDIDPRVFTSRAYADDPYPTLRLLRDHHPVYRNPLRSSG